MRALNIAVILAVCITSITNANISKSHLLSTHHVHTFQNNIGQLAKISNELDASIVAHSSINDNVSVQKQLDSNLASEVLAGFVVSLATIPKAIAYSSVLGVSPLTGIWTSVIVSLFTTLLGNCPGILFHQTWSTEPILN